LLDVLYEVLEGRPLAESVVEHSGASDLESWLPLPDEVVVGRLLSPACYVDDAVPATLYLALKYARDPERALIVNTNLGGDNCHRGAVLGALLGAAHGPDAWPRRWLDVLRVTR
jgi:hypothetical protein